MQRNLTYWSTSRDFLIRFVILIARICVLVIGVVQLFESIFYDCAECTGFAPGYLENFLLGVTLVFPFKLLKKPLYVWLYFITLVVSTGFYVSQRIQYLPWEKHILVLLIINVLAVFQYIRHFIDPKKFNPFFPVKNLALVFLAIALLGGYFLFDVHETKDGTRYFNMENLIFFFPTQKPGRDAGGDWEPTRHLGDPIYTKAAFKELTQLDGGGSSVSITISPEKKGDIELHENGQKIMQIEFGEKGVGKVTAYDASGSTVESSGPQAWMRDKKGEFHSDVWKYEYGNGYSQNKDYDLSISFEYTFFASKYGYWGGDDIKYSSGDALRISINKSIAYPERASWQLLPFERKTLPWNLAIKQGDKMVKVVEGIKIWYR